MQQQVEKQTWEAPKLILLGRGNPEELVLQECFYDEFNGLWIVLELAAAS